jgi:hypothetical protein
MARTLDLDAKRAARSEAENQPHSLVLGGQTFELPPRMPLLFLDYLTQMDFGGAMRTLFGEAWPKFAVLDPEMDDLIDIAEELYGIGDFFGRPSGSPASSDNGGTPAKPTSKHTTGSTSRRAATAPAISGSDGSSPS